MTGEVDRLGTAYHEAGHAVIARVVGLTCGQVTILPDEDSSAHCVVEDPWLIYSDWDRRGKFRDVSSVFVGRTMSYMAGREAEELILGKSNGGDIDDLRWIDIMLESIPAAQDDPECYATRLRRRTRAMLSRHAEAVRRLAGALIERGTLSVDEADEIAGIPKPIIRPTFWNT